MPIHDWTRVDPGTFHDFHQAWVFLIKVALNRVLPPDYYAMTEQQGAGFELDVLTLRSPGLDDSSRPLAGEEAGLLVAEPPVRVRAETDLEFYRRKQNVVAVRHSSGDELVAIVEVVSKGNKSSRKALDDFVRKAAEFLSRGVHLLVLDLQPPTSRDPQGIHGRIWDEMAGEEYGAPADKPLTLASYDAAGGLRAFVEPVAVGDSLIDMPLFLTARAYVPVPLEATYRAAVEAVPRRWRAVLEPA